MLLTDILTPTQAQGDITQILDGLADLDVLGELSVGNTVLIRSEDMYSLNIDADLP